MCVMLCLRSWLLKGAYARPLKLSVERYCPDMYTVVREYTVSINHHGGWLGSLRCLSESKVKVHP